MTKTKLWVFAVVFCFFGILIGIKEAGHFLVIDEKPIKSDIVIVLSGGGIERLNKGVELYKNGYASSLMISNGQEDNLYEAALIRGVPAQSVTLENNASSTSENAIYTINLMMNQKWKSAIIVSSNFHMRRVKMNFARAVEQKDTSLRYISVNDSHYDADRWWVQKEDRRATFIEYVKLVGNYFGLHGDEAKKLLTRLLNI